MKPLLRHLLLACALLYALVGCGPGVGGTGTGSSPSDLANFGAVAAPLCAAPFAPSLRCPAGSGTAPGPAGSGTALVVFVDAATGGQTTAVLQANGIDLDARCQRLRFFGDWGTTASGEARFFGSYVTDASPARQPAQLGVAAAAQGGLVISLLAADGSVVLGPLLLLAAATPPAAPANCS